MAELYTVGNFTIDDIVMHDGRTWMDQAGGNALYSALGARVWFDRVGLMARLGDDLPKHYLETLTTLDVELAHTRVPLPNLHNWALYEPDGRRQFVNHLSSGSNDDISIRATEISPEHRSAAAYHLAPMPSLRQEELVRALKRDNNFISLDPHELWIVGYEELLLNLLSLVDFFLPSREEAQRLYGSDAPARAVREFARHGSRVTVVKLGADGSLVYDALAKRLTHVPVWPAQVVDVTGAGDAYCGGFLAGYLETRDPVQAACYGTVSASFCVENLGALPTRRPTRAEAEARRMALREKITVVEAPA
jgi:sugar/nucleoside kinase (ribokinase family)